MNKLSFLALAALTASSVSAQISLDLTNDAGTFNGSFNSSPIGDGTTYTVSSLSNGSPSESGWSNMESRAEPSGSLSGVLNTASFSFIGGTFTASTLSGSDFSTSDIGQAAFASNGSGIEIAGAGLTGDRGFFLQFDVSNFDPGYTLRVTGATATVDNAGTTDSMQLIFGSSTFSDGGDLSITSTNTTSGTGMTLNDGSINYSGLALDISDGDYLFFRNTGDSQFRVSSLTFDAVAVPEPSAFALIAGAFGLVSVMLRHRRS
ncbi:hypothetical protein [Coraliomargarita sinensis]|nr:hypothetical protein [Coraliomargarita sinensis]